MDIQEIIVATINQNYKPTVKCFFNKSFYKRKNHIKIFYGENNAGNDKALSEVEFENIKNVVEKSITNYTV